MAAAGPVLPVGAIATADPQHVLQASMSARHRGAATKARGGQTVSQSSRSLGQVPDTRSSQVTHFPAWTVEAGTESMFQTKPNDEAPRGRQKERARKTKRKNKKHRSDDTQRRRRSSFHHREEGIDASMDASDPPMRLIDTRTDLETYVDGLISDSPILDRLEAFEEGSVLDYIDMIGITRDEAFASFPKEISELPSVPGSQGIESVLEKIKRATPLGSRSTPAFQKLDDMLARQDLLMDALTLESRRADLLQYQVMMLRNELVLALKRWKVLSTGAMSFMICQCRSGEEKRREVQRSVEDFKPAERLSNGKFVHLHREHAEIMDAFRKRHRDDRGRDGNESDEDLSEDSSIPSSEIWSSSSEEE